MTPSEKLRERIVSVLFGVWPDGPREHDLSDAQDVLRAIAEELGWTRETVALLNLATCTAVTSTEPWATAEFCDKLAELEGSISRILDAAEQ